ncbi:AI-2E family transporter [Parvularcula dongshanensis]|uniref:Putative PurR-regulated permease PerM n=1 Tax=Parvularcula dongshanensis TaxID=1173995 RepID=A0A840I2M4_9PROT|nr:AI-2E family transporter [Parvularcula dongshanensis]MBB4658300.1 putative PurR-regulated permease PerM [Parvularcula dongshanensis]
MRQDDSAALPQTATPPVPRRSLAALFFGTGLAIMLAFVLWVAKGVIVPVVVAAFVSFLIVTVKRGIDRVPVIGPRLPEPIEFTLAFAVIVLALFGLGLVIRDNIEEVLAQWPAYQARFTELATAAITWANEHGLVNQDASEALADVPQQLIEFGRGALGDVAEAAGGILGGLVTIGLYTAFMLVERGRFFKKITRIAGPRDARAIVSDVIDDIGHLVRQYISIKTLTSLMVAAVSFVIMMVLGVDFAAFWALVIFAFNFIPIIGSIVAVILPCVLALVQPEGGPGLALLTLGLLTAAEQAVGSVVEPRLLGKSLNLSPLVILLSLASWGTLWGFAGMLLCVPITVAIMIVLSQFESTRAIAILLSDNGEIAPLKRGHTDLEERGMMRRGEALGQ